MIIFISLDSEDWYSSCSNYANNLSLPLELRQVRMDGKAAFFSRPEPDKLFINGVHVPVEVESSTSG